MNSIYNVNAKEEVFRLLDDELYDERVQKELSYFVDNNYIELLLTKYIADFLKENKIYYLIGGDIEDLYVAYLLGITSINPNSLENYIPFEVAFDKWRQSLSPEFRIPSGIFKMLRAYLRTLSDNKVVNAINILNNGRIKKLKEHFLFPLVDDAILNCDYSKIDELKVIKITISDFTFLDDINYFINKYGMPKDDPKTDTVINKEIFEKQNIAGITLSHIDEMKKLLKSCDEEIWNFDTFVYIYGMVLNITNYPNSIECNEINRYIINKYPTTRAVLYNKCIELGLSHEDALQVYYFTKKNKYDSNGERNKEWQRLYNLLPFALAEYLDHINYMWPTIPAITYSELNYLEMYYKIIAPDFYQIKLKEYLAKYDSKSMEEIDELIKKQEAKEFKSDKYEYLLLYKEYKSRLLS